MKQFRPPARRVRAGPVSWIVRTLLVLGGVALIATTVQWWGGLSHSRGATVTVVKTAPATPPGYVIATIELRYREHTLRWEQLKTERFHTGVTERATLRSDNALVKKENKENKAMLVAGVAAGLYLLLAALAFSKRFDFLLVGLLGMITSLTASVAWSIATLGWERSAPRYDVSDSLFVGLGLGAGTAVMIRTWAGGYVGAPWSVAVREKRLAKSDTRYTVEKRGGRKGLEVRSLTLHRNRWDQHKHPVEERMIPQPGSYATKEGALVAARGLAREQDTSPWDVTEWHVFDVCVQGTSNRGSLSIEEEIPVVPLNVVEAKNADWEDEQETGRSSEA